MSKDELYRQSLTDMLRVAIVLGEILETKSITMAEDRRIKYCAKSIRNVIEKQKTINKIK